MKIQKDNKHPYNSDLNPMSPFDRQSPLKVSEQTMLLDSAVFMRMMLHMKNVTTTQKLQANYK